MYDRPRGVLSDNRNGACPFHYQHLYGIGIPFEIATYIFGKGTWIIIKCAVQNLHQLGAVSRYPIFTSLVKVIPLVVIWSRSFGHFRFRERGYLLTIYINISIYIIVAVLTASVFDFDQMTNDQMTACLKKIYFFFLKYSRTAMKDSYLCSVKTMKQERRPLRIKIARFKSRNCAH